MTIPDDVAIERQRTQKRGELLARRDRLNAKRVALGDQLASVESHLAGIDTDLDKLDHPTWHPDPGPAAASSPLLNGADDDDTEDTDG